MLDENGISNYVMTLRGKYYISRYKQIFVENGVYFIFLGIFDSVDKVPSEVNCIYIVDDVVYKQIAVRTRIPRSGGSKITSMETHNPSDDLALKIEIRPSDDELMVIIKSLLLREKTTVGKFKKMYGEERKTDMNNDKSRLETKNTLSWNKATYLSKMLGYRYELLFFKDEEGETNV